jgi:hypothetical protein
LEPPGLAQLTQVFLRDLSLGHTLRLSQLSDTAHTAGAFSLTVTGTGFVPDSLVRFGGQGRTTIYQGPTRLLARILRSDLAAPGPVEITVVNPGLGPSAPAIFTVR